MCHSYGLLCHLIIVITCENLQRRKVTDSPMCLSRYMHVACVLAVESLTRTCDSASILEPVTAASKNQRHVLCWAPQPHVNRDCTWWQPPDTYASHLFPPPSGFPSWYEDARCHRAFSTSIYLEPRNEGEDAPGSEIWPMEDSYKQVSPGAFCFCMDSLERQPLLQLCWWHSTWHGCDQLSNNPLIFLFPLSQSDSPFP